MAEMPLMLNGLAESLTGSSCMQSLRTVKSDAHLAFLNAVVTGAFDGWPAVAKQTNKYKYIL